MFNCAFAIAIGLSHIPLDQSHITRTTIALKSYYDRAKSEKIQIMKIVGNDLAHSIRNSSISVLASPGNSSSIQRFFPDGRYEVSGHRGDRNGSYQISNNEVCITLSSSKSCFELYKLGGRFYVQYGNSGAKIEVEISKL